jgi:hypothetical protein
MTTDDAHGFIPGGLVMLPKSRLQRLWKKLARKPATHIIYLRPYQTEEEARQMLIDRGMARPSDRIVFIGCKVQDEPLPPGVGPWGPESPP